MLASPEEFARRIRVHAVRMTNQARSSHVGSSLSMAEILAVLYGGVLQIDPSNPTDPDRDRLILSKGHACAGLYAALAESGFFPLDWLDSFYTDGARLAGHATAGRVPGIEVSTGSLGHGLPIACGMAKAGKIDARTYRVVTILSDGECDEGSTWEAALFAPHHGLDNLVAIIDYNKSQGLGPTGDVLGLEPFADKWRAFGWTIREVDGHDARALRETLQTVPFARGTPSCLIARTIKGKGIEFMENSTLWHYRTPQGDEYAAAMRALGEAS